MIQAILEVRRTWNHHPLLSCVSCSRLSSDTSEAELSTFVIGFDPIEISKGETVLRSRVPPGLSYTSGCTPHRVIHHQDYNSADDGHGEAVQIQSSHSTSTE